MAYDKELAEKARQSLFKHGWQDVVEEKEKNEGLSFTLKNEPFIRIEGEQLLIRCYPEDTDTYLQEPGIYRYEADNKIDIKGWLRLIPELAHSPEHLYKWLQVSYNYVSTLN